MIDARIERIIMELRPIDDDFMRIIFKDNKPLVEYVLRIILNMHDLVVEESQAQYEIDFIGARRYSLDVFARDSTGKNYNIEVQRSDTGASPKRARCHSGIIDTSAMSKGSKFNSIPDTYVIFITENYVLGGQLPTYTIERVILETGKMFDDGSHIVYVNGTYKDINTELGRLIHDFTCRSADTMLCTPMADVTRKFKNTTEGVDYMCEALEEYRRQERAIGREEGIIESIQKLIKAGSMSLENIASTFSLSIDEVRKIAESC